MNYASETLAGADVQRREMDRIEVLANRLEGLARRVADMRVRCAGTPAAPQGSTVQATSPGYFGHLVRAEDAVERLDSQISLLSNIF